MLGVTEDMRDWYYSDGSPVVGSDYEPMPNDVDHLAGELEDSKILLHKEDICKNGN